MKKNVSKSGGFIRVLLAIILFAAFYLLNIEDELINNILIICSLILVITALLKYCPIFHFFGINQNKINNIKMY